MKTKTLVYMALFIALSIVLTRIIRFMPTTYVRISLTFIVYAVCGFMFGPGITAVVAILSDIVGFVLFPEAAAFNFGFTISSGITGFLFGLMRGHPKDWKRLIVILLVITVVVEMGMNTYWLTLLYNTVFMTQLIARLSGIAVNLGLRVILLIPLMRAFERGVFSQEG